LPAGGQDDSDEEGEKRTLGAPRRSASASPAFLDTAGAVLGDATIASAGPRTASSSSSRGGVGCVCDDICGEKFDFLAAAFAGDGGGEEPSQMKRKKSKKPKDPVVLAQKRVLQRMRKEAKAARKARKRERKKLAQRRGVGQDVEAFLMRTVERLQAKAAEAMAEAARAAMVAAAAAAEERRGNSSGDLQAFLKRTRGRAADRSALADAAAKAQQAAEEAAATAQAKLEEFQERTKERLEQRMMSHFPQADGGVTGLRRRRIAIIGAGPVGLWAAVLLMQKHRFADGCGSLARWPDAPDIVIYEGRPQEKHCTRTDIRISLSPATCNLLNGRAKSKHFRTGMPVAEIEERLLKRLRRVAPQCKPIFGRPIDDPVDLAAEGFDCLLWAGGRRSLNDGVRKALRCGVEESENARVLVFQFKDMDAQGSVHYDLAHAASQATKWHGFKVLLRPGVKGVCDGWLWLFGLPPDTVAVKPANGLEPAATFDEAVRRVVEPQGTGAEALLGAAELFQSKIRSAECTARWVDAAFWAAERSVCDLGVLDGNYAGTPLILLGDALCGKPFYTGTTLNGHLKDVAAMIDEVDWIHDGAPMATTRWQAHERRYQEDVRRGIMDRRGAFASGAGGGAAVAAAAAAPAPPPPARQSPLSPTREPSGRSIVPAIAQIATSAPKPGAQLSPSLLRTTSLPRLATPPCGPDSGKPQLAAVCG